MAAFCISTVGVDGQIDYETMDGLTTLIEKELVEEGVFGRMDKLPKTKFKDVQHH